MYKAFIVLIFFIILTVCCSHSVSYIPKDRLFDGKERKIYSEMNFDKYGRPEFSNLLKSKPATLNSTFYLIDINKSNGNMIRTFRMTNAEFKDKEISATRPFKVVYEWTARGFRSSVDITKLIIEAAAKTDPRGGIVVVGLIGATFIIGTGGGFTVGIVNGIKEEIERPFVKYVEWFSGYFKYFYDNDNRLIKMIEYIPTEKPEPVIETIYSYKNKLKIPYRIEVKSITEEKSRIIDIKN